MVDRLYVRTIEGRPSVVVATRGTALSAAQQGPQASLRETIDQAITALPATAGPLPLSAEAWLEAVATCKLSPTACRAAMIFALHGDGQWLGVEALGRRIDVGFRMASAATRALMRRGYLERITDGTRAVYRRRLP